MATAETRHLRREALDEALDEIDRAVLATGATDAEGEIAAVGGAVFGDAGADELRVLIEQSLHFRPFVEPADHRRIAPRERSQGGVPVRVRQRACIEDEVAVAVAESDS